MDYEKLSDDRFGEPSSHVQARVESTREIQRYRFQNSKIEQKPKKSRQISANSDMHLAEIRTYCELDIASQSLMHSAMSQVRLFAQAFHRVLKLARTIADLSGEVKNYSSTFSKSSQVPPKIRALPKSNSYISTIRQSQIKYLILR